MAKFARSFLLLPVLAAALMLSPLGLLGRGDDSSSAVTTIKRSGGSTLILRSTKKKHSTPGATPGVTPAPPPPSAQPDANGELQLAAWGAIVIDALTGKVLYEKNADAPQYPASTTKIMTALLVIEEGDLDHEVVCDVEDSKVGESSLELKPGEQFTRRQMLYGLMLKSANDVAHALGRDNAGSIEAFAEKMTRRAKELGAQNTHFANPNGLHNVEHYTTPRDLALIARAAMQQPFFRQVVGTREYNWAVNGAVNPLRNHNRLLERYPGCTGVKTGYTIPAQQVLVSSAMRGNNEVISVVMHTDKPGIWNDSMLLLSYGLDKLSAESTAAATTAGSQGAPASATQPALPVP